MSQVPQKLTKLGMAVQVAKGSAAAAPVNIWPLGERGGLSTTRNQEYWDTADGRAHIGLFMERSEWYEGDINVPLIPTFVAGTSGIEALMLTRGGDWQGTWFTVFQDLGSNYRRTFVDCKVRSWRLTFEAGQEPALSWTVGALSRTTASEITAAAIAFEPYLCKEISVESAAFGSTYSSDVTLKRLEINGNNRVTGFEEELRLGGSCRPLDQPNTAGPTVEGSLDSEFSSSTLIDAFEAGTLMKVKITLERPGVATCIAELPRIHYNANPLLPGGGGDAMISQDGVSFTALGSGADYATAPMTMTETVP